MRVKDKMKLLAGAALFAAVLYALAGAPGVISDQDSLVPVAATLQAGR